MPGQPPVLCSGLCSRCRRCSQRKTCGQHCRHPGRGAPGRQAPIGPGSPVAWSPPKSLGRQPRFDPCFACSSLLILSGVTRSFRRIETRLRLNCSDAVSCAVRRAPCAVRRAPRAVRRAPCGLGISKTHDHLASRRFSCLECEKRPRSERGH